MSRLGTVLPRVMRSPPLLVTVSLTEAIIIRRHRNDASLAVSSKASERLNSTPLGREISLNMPNWVAVFVASVMNGLYSGGCSMRFDRCAGGDNFDFDTDVCTQCGI